MAKKAPNVQRRVQGKDRSRTVLCFICALAVLPFALLSWRYYISHHAPVVRSGSIGQFTPPYTVPNFPRLPQKVGIGRPERNTFKEVHWNTKIDDIALPDSTINDVFTPILAAPTFTGVPTRVGVVIPVRGDKFPEWATRSSKKCRDYSVAVSIVLVSTSQMSNDTIEDFANTHHLRQQRGTLFKWSEVPTPMMWSNDEASLVVLQLVLRDFKFPSFADLLHGGIFALPGQTHYLFLSEAHVPYVGTHAALDEVPACLVIPLVRLMQERNAAAVQCTVVMPLPSVFQNVSGLSPKRAARLPLASLTTVDQGLEIGVMHGTSHTASYVIRRLHGFTAKDQRLKNSVEVDLVGPYCLLVEKISLLQAGAFMDEVSQQSSSLLTRILSHSLDKSVVNQVAGIVKYRLWKVESVMEGISLHEVYRSGIALRQQVRISYSEVVEASAAYEDVYGQAFDMHAATTEFVGSTTDKDETSELAATMSRLVKVDRLALLTQRLHDAVKKMSAIGKGSDTSTNEEEVGWSLSVRYRRLWPNRPLIVAPVFVVFNKWLLPSPLKVYFDTSRLPLVYSSYTLGPDFYDAYGAILQVLRHTRTSNILPALIIANPEKKFHPQVFNISDRINFIIFWNAYCCGCCGFSSEIVHFVMPLSKRHLIQLLPGPQCFCTGYPHAVEDVLRRSNIKQEQYLVQYRGVDDVSIWISHTDPLGYNPPLLTKRGVDYTVGRSMYEFTRIGQNWVDATATVDELWVPATFVLKMFRASGVIKEMVVIPEAIDVNFFNPDSHTPIPLPLRGARREKWFHWCNKGPSREKPLDDEFIAAHSNDYKFFSSFKWEPRKGWKTLFTSYFNEFGTVANVSLYIQSYYFFNGPQDSNQDIHNYTLITREIHEWALQELPGYQSLEDFPFFCIITEHVSEVDVARLYRSVDAFVLPTHGEGWGLPTIQAMAMGLPTISTNWGGNMEFMSKNTSFLIEIDGLEEIDANSYYGYQLGKKWAIPSLEDTSKWMKYVFHNEKHAKVVGSRARRHIETHFSEEAVADIVDLRLAEIGLRVLARRHL